MDFNWESEREPETLDKANEVNRILARALGHLLQKSEAIVVQFPDDDEDEKWLISNHDGMINVALIPEGDDISLEGEEMMDGQMFWLTQKGDIQ